MRSQQNNGWTPSGRPEKKQRVLNPHLNKSSLGNCFVLCQIKVLPSRSTDGDSDVPGPKLLFCNSLNSSLSWQEAVVLPLPLTNVQWFLFLHLAHLIHLHSRSVQGNRMSHYSFMEWLILAIYRAGDWKADSIFRPCAHCWRVYQFCWTARSLNAEIFILFCNFLVLIYLWSGTVRKRANTQ